MEGVLLGVAALACPVGMGVMMWFMAKGMRNNNESNVREGIEPEGRAERR